MAIPDPEAGLVIRFNYLWKREHDLERDNARYPRPCAIILSHRRASDGLTMVLVAPITHSEPNADTQAVELPPRVKQHLGLDDAKSWVVVDEVNEFAWPGFDLAPNPGGEIAYGHLPSKLYEKIRLRVGATSRASFARMKPERSIFDDVDDAADEAAMIEGEADIAAGRVISHQAMKAWLLSWGTADELPPPRVGD